MPQFFPIPCLIFPINKSKKQQHFFYYFRDHYYLWETMTHIRMILKHLCLSGMLDIIQYKIFWFWGYNLLPLYCSMSLILMLSRPFFPTFGQGPFPKSAGKSPGSPCISLEENVKECLCTIGLDVATPIWNTFQFSLTIFHMAKL